MRHLKKHILTGLLILFLIPVKAQLYWVVLTDKANTSFNPYEYFNEKAIERRNNLGISLYDSTDFPLNLSYVEEIEKIAGSIIGESRWLNAVSVKADIKTIKKVSSLPFVYEVREATMTTTAARAKEVEVKDDLESLMEEQINSMQGNLFIENNIDGKGTRIAIFDAGFPGVDKLEAFKHLRDNNQIVATYDFVKKKEDVYKYNSHGTKVLSCIGGKYGNKKTGLATGAEFLLARTEVALEPYSEEVNWMEAVEWADKNGADIINSSLGYTKHRYKKGQMDGKTSFVVKAANLAAKKGILVVNAIGNDGNDEWEFLGTPADADSIISVGGIDPNTGYHIYFSSYGPTADKRLKPNVSAYGKVAFPGDKKTSSIFGTSFSSPLVAGFAACALQLNPDWSNMELFHEIEKSGSLYPYFDYAHGYGIPQASYFLADSTENAQPSFSFNIDEGFVNVSVDTTLIEENHNILYYHIENEEGYLKKYAVIKVYQKDVISFRKEDLAGCILRVHFNGYTESLKNLN